MADSDDGDGLRHRKHPNEGSLVSEEELPLFQKQRKKLRIEVEADDTSAPLLGEESKKEEVKKAPFGVWEYLVSEITNDYSLNNDTSMFMEKRKKVYAFLKIPSELEKFISFGLLQCFDAFCHVFTFLPIKMFFNFLCILIRRKDWASSDSVNLIKLITIICCSFLMMYVDTSIIYHQVRGQAILKLYVFFNMLDVADKLCSSYGQDTFDALYLTVSEKGKRRKVFQILGFLGLAMALSIIHTIVLLLQATTLNVAFNSHSQAFLTIIISNNFVELKGSVFKKLPKPNLFQMACSDVKERFTTFILLIVVILRNMTAVNWKWDHFTEMAPDLILVLLAEVMIDWFKHAFITKFNEINAEVYQDFTITLAFDVVKSKEENGFTDFSDQVARRMGFIPINLLILLIRILSQSFTLTSNVIIIMLCSWFGLLVVKIGVGLALYKLSCRSVDKYRTMQANAEYNLYRKRLIGSKSKSVPSSPKMGLLDFSDVLTQPKNKDNKDIFFSDLLVDYPDFANTPAQIYTTPNKSAADPKTSTPTDTPRRSVSMIDFSAGKGKRDSSLPPSIKEDEESGSESNSEPNSTPLPTKEKEAEATGKKSTSGPKYLLDVGLSFTSRFADTCDDASFTLQQIVTLVGNSVYCGINEEQVKKNVNETYKYTIAGVGSFSGEIGMNINYLFQAFCIPVISGTTNSAALDNPSSYKYFMRAGASDIYKARTVLHFLQSQNWFHIIVISDSLSSGSAIRKLFKSYVSECIVANGKGSLFRRPCVEKYSELTFEGSQSESMLNADLAEIKSILKVSAVQTLVLFMSSKNVNLFLSLLTNWNIKPGTYQLILTDRDDLNISPHLNESYLIEEDVPHLPTFDTLIKINTISATTNPYVKELIQLQNVCCWNDVDDSVYEDTPQCAYSMPCHPDTTLNNIPLSARRQARLVYNAINVLAAGLRSFHQNFCVGIRGMCPSLVRNANGKTLMDFLKNASFYDENDQLVTMNGRSGKPAYNIYQFNGSAYHILMPAYNPFHGPTPKKENRDSFGSSLKDQVDKHNEDCQKNCRTSNAVPDMIDQCCWTCTPCTGPKSYLNDSMAICAQCKDDQIPKDDKSGCIDEPQPDIFVDMNAGKIVVLTGAGIGLILCLISLCFMYSQRQTPMYKASTPDLNCIQLTTTAILFLVSILMLPTSRQFLCASGWFLFSICTSILHSISFAKAVRIGRPPILDKSELISKDLRLSSHIFIFLSFLIQLIISMIWVLLRVPTIKPLLDRNRYCTSNTETQTTILFLFPSLFIIISFYPIHYALKNRYIFQVGQARVLLVSSLCNIASYLTLFIMLFTESLQGQPTTVVPVLLPVIPAYISFISITLSISWQMVFRKKQNLHEFISRERSRQFQVGNRVYYVDAVVLENGKRNSTFSIQSKK
uniref:G_PROTEIN_RECEP_F3_4 domain-containing protein n=1 Tax=Rhabditophanes sp. KR3021 TaxID=114890 RepID=A0AC35UCQ9_9BILA